MWICLFDYYLFSGLNVESLAFIIYQYNNKPTVGDPAGY